MNCPWCAFRAAPRSLHAHLADTHPEGVRFEQHHGAPAYVVVCPLCDASHVQAIKPHSRDAEFVSQYEHEIRLVGFDMLVNHLMAEHADQDLGSDPAPSHDALTGTVLEGHGDQDADAP